MYSLRLLLCGCYGLKTMKRLGSWEVGPDKGMWCGRVLVYSSSHALLILRYVCPCVCVCVYVAVCFLLLSITLEYSFPVFFLMYILQI